MSKIKNSEKKFIAILSIALICLMATGVSAATLFKTLESRANVLTFGDLNITLTETQWDKLTPEDKLTYPGREIVKDPVVTNDGKTEAYVYMQVTIPRANVRTVSENGMDIIPAADTDLFTYTVNSGWQQIGTEAVAEDGNSVTYTYAYTAAAVAPGKSAPALFDKVIFANTLEGEPEMGTVLEIYVTAIGIQSGYLNETGSTLAEKIINAYQLSQT